MILVTGGCGFIGSHAVVELIENGDEVLVLDNLSNSSVLVLDRIERITNSKCLFVEGDICDFDLLLSIFRIYPIDSVMHFAGLKSVAESAERPLNYYSTNLCGTITLCKAMLASNIYKLIFSSSATVYGSSNVSPMKEYYQIGETTNPYGTTKYMVERFLDELCNSVPQFSVCILRYFNPIGAHSSGLIGESPSDAPNNLIPYLLKVGDGTLPSLKVFGGDYETKDGTGVRDYIHVVDLVLGHLKAKQYLESNFGCHVFNLGTGNGYSVLQIIEKMSEVIGRKIEFDIVDRRSGDIPVCYADPSRALEELKWSASRELLQMLTDSWRWQLSNPKGYQD